MHRLCCSSLLARFSLVTLILFTSACKTTIEAKHISKEDYLSRRFPNNSVHYALPKSETEIRVPYSFRKKGVSRALFESLLHRCTHEKQDIPFADPYCRASLQPDIQYSTADVRTYAVADLDKVYAVDLHSNEGAFVSSTIQLSVGENGVVSGFGVASENAAPDIAKSVIQGVLEIGLTTASHGIFTTSARSKSSGVGTTPEVNSQFASKDKFYQVAAADYVFTDKWQKLVKANNPSAFVDTVDAPPQCRCRYLRDISDRTLGLRKNEVLYEGTLAADIGDKFGTDAAEHILQNPTGGKAAPSAPNNVGPLNPAATGVDGNLQRVRMEYLKSEIERHRSKYEDTLRSYSITRIQQEFDGTVVLKPLVPAELGGHCIWVGSIYEMARTPSEGHDAGGKWREFLKATANSLVLARIDDMHPEQALSVWPKDVKTGDCIPGATHSPPPAAPISVVRSPNQGLVRTKVVEPEKTVEGLPYRFPARTAANVWMVQAGKWEGMDLSNSELRKALGECATKRLLQSGKPDGRSFLNRSLEVSDVNLENQWRASCKTAQKPSLCIAQLETARANASSLLVEAIAASIDTDSKLLAKEEEAYKAASVAAGAAGKTPPPEPPLLIELRKLISQLPDLRKHALAKQDLAEREMRLAIVQEQNEDDSASVTSQETLQKLNRATAISLGKLIAGIISSINQAGKAAQLTTDEQRWLNDATRLQQSDADTVTTLSELSNLRSVVNSLSDIARTVPVPATQGENGLCRFLPLVSVPVFEGEIPIAQFGTLMSLPAEFFGKSVNLQLSSDPKTGVMRDLKLQKSGLFGK